MIVVANEREVYTDPEQSAQVRFQLSRQALTTASGSGRFCVERLQCWSSQTRIHCISANWFIRYVVDTTRRSRSRWRHRPTSKRKYPAASVSLGTSLGRHAVRHASTGSHLFRGELILSDPSRRSSGGTVGKPSAPFILLCRGQRNRFGCGRCFGVVHRALVLGRDVGILLHLRAGIFNPDV